jgi:hypothetical protein
MVSPHCQERRLKQHLPVRRQDTHIGDSQETLIPVQFVNETLIPADMYTPAQHVRSGLDGGMDRDFGHKISEDFSPVIVFKTHGTSL